MEQTFFNYNLNYKFITGTGGKAFRVFFLIHLEEKDLCGPISEFLQDPRRFDPFLIFPVQINAPKNCQF